jgi:hypothetical protein
LKVKVPFVALPGDEVEFDLPCGHVLSVAIPIGAKPGDII